MKNKYAIILCCFSFLLSIATTFATNNAALNNDKKESNHLTTSTNDGNITVVCQNFIAQLDASGNVTILPEDIDGGSFSDTGLVTLSIDVNTFTCADIGPNTVTLIVMDGDGDVDSCQATVTIQDAILPTAVCQNITISLDPAGIAIITPSQLDNGSFDNCSIVATTIDFDTFTCANLGNNTITLTIEDSSGNIDACTATVTVLENQMPVASCQNINVFLDASGVITILPSDIDNGSFFGCDNTAVNLSLNNDTFDCSDIGTNAVLLTAENGGMTATCNAVVTVLDIIAPEAVCQNITIELNPAGVATILPSQVDGGSTDNCTIANASIDIDMFDCSNLGDNNVTLTVTDTSGNSNTCVAIVTVVVGGTPTAICQNITLSLNAIGMATIVASDIDNGSTDNCGGTDITLEASITEFDCSNVGDNNVILTVTQLNGNTATCMAVITILDDILPAVQCQAITVILDASGNATITPADIDDGSFDNCGFTLAIDQDTFDCTNVGANAVTLTATDDAGNINSCTVLVMVIDDTLPEALCQSLTLTLDALGMATIAPGDIDNGSNDACGIDTLTLDIDTFDCSNLGDNDVTLTVTDVNGNVSTCTAVVTIEDTTPPEAICQNITITLNAMGVATIEPEDIDGGSNDNCGSSTLVLTADITSFDCSNVGDNTITLTVTQNDGSTATCEAIVTVEDTGLPVVTCNDITVALDAMGMATITAADIDDGSFDNCAIDLLSIDVDTFDCTNIGPNVVTLTIADTSGNTAECTAIVTIVDDEGPITNCLNISIVLDAMGMASITEADIDAASSDNCGIDTITIDQTDFDCSDVGENEVTLTIIDVNGNENSCIAIVTVIDSEFPVAICQNLTVQLDAMGMATITAAEINNGSTDNCVIANIELDITELDCTNLGENEVTLSITDTSGNTATCVATVTVLEVVLPPVAVCQSITVVVEDNGSVTITPEDIDNGSSGQSCLDGLSLDIDTFTCSDIGTPVQVTLTVTNAEGVIDSCIAIVTIADSLPPVITCPPNQTVISTGPYELPDYFDTGEATAVDNCSGIQNLDQDPAPGTPLQQGTYIITMTAEDENGFEGECEFILVVNDLLGNNDPSLSITTISTYPNPASNLINISNPQLIQISKVSIYDLNGRLALNENISILEDISQIDISRLQSAGYILLIESEYGTIIKQLVKE
jgi:uncharacterized protein YrzB (UPF0473 family)